MKGNGGEGGLRLVRPPKVMEALDRQRGQVVTVSRKRAARRAVDTRRERGDVIGNPEALKEGAAGAKGGAVMATTAKRRSIKFDTTQEESHVVMAIARRAVLMAAKARIDYDFQSACMDITAAHSNGCPLKLGELLVADDFNFSHDVFGIRRHIDRTTGELGGCFVPRLAAPERP